MIIGERMITPIYESMVMIVRGSMRMNLNKRMRTSESAQYDNGYMKEDESNQINI
jgi:hypothetical protein